MYRMKNVSLIFKLLLLFPYINSQSEILARTEIVTCDQPLSTLNVPQTTKKSFKILSVVKYAQQKALFETCLQIANLLLSRWQQILHFALACHKGCSNNLVSSLRYNC